MHVRDFKVSLLFHEAVESETSPAEIEVKIREAVQAHYPNATVSAEYQADREIDPDASVLFGGSGEGHEAKEPGDNPFTPIFNQDQDQQ